MCPTFGIRFRGSVKLIDLQTGWEALSVNSLLFPPVSLLESEIKITKNISSYRRNRQLRANGPKLVLIEFTGTLAD